MPSRPPQTAPARRRALVVGALLIGLIGSTGSGCLAPASRDALWQPETLKGKSQAWFLERWGMPRARAKRWFGGETWVYFRIDGGSRALPLFIRAPLDCQRQLTFNQDGILRDAVQTGC